MGEHYRYFTPGMLQAFLTRTRASLTEEFGPEVTGPLERIERIREHATPELLAAVMRGGLSVTQAEELVRLDAESQREAVAAGLHVARRVAREMRVLRLYGPSPYCLVCGHALDATDIDQQLRRSDADVGRERMSSSGSERRRRREWRNSAMERTR
jgi:hypothetical protein